MDNRPVRVFLDGRDAILAHRAASNSAIFEDADPSPLAEAVTSGAIADFAGMRDESFNDNYEMPMSWRDRTTQHHADGRSTIGEGEPDSPSFGWRTIDQDDQTLVLASGDEKSICIVEIANDPDSDAVSVRSASYPAEDLNKYDEDAAASNGLDQESWNQSPLWMRAYAKLLYYGGDYRAFDSKDEALEEITGSPILPEA